ncbi:IS1249 family transposase [Subtercola endophyticus]|uniref:IS1249 family transposase n=1 Tax=Subtercola endophyticus TaxID=2895559 RepID=UPI00210823F2|nr:IS1249 family transposase [Subtercola endophyticus]
MICATVLVKNGRTAAGTQRWRCPNCGSSAVRKRPDVTRREQLRRFLEWLSSNEPQPRLGDTSTGRSFRYETAWCWDIQPTLGPSTKTHHAILVDGLWVGTWCLLIAVSDQLDVLGWQWCGSESVAAWTALLQQIPAPAVIVSDGGTGLPSAIRKCWPETKHQRCLFHIQMNISRHLTFKPRTDAGRALLGLSKALSKVHTTDDAIQWRVQLDQWWQAFGHLTKERTVIRDGKFWFTHERLRKAWQLLARVTKDGTLFTYVTYGNPRTTSPLEGGINAQIRTRLRAHRGMTEPHMKRAAEWYLTLHELSINDALSHANQHTANPTHPTPESAEEPDTPTLYDTGLNAEEGLWTRAGWAGPS